jgi:UDP-N-acetylmuramyl pentapeptide phosphotransferase/UDP-N-acetylglucosamine-1-phosphate transferase
VNRQATFKITLFALIYALITFATRAFVYPKLSDHSISYLQLAEVAIIGYFAMKIVNELATKLLNERHSKSQARSARSIIRIGGLLIILAIVVIIMLARQIRI